MPDIKTDLKYLFSQNLQLFPACTIMIKNSEGMMKKIPIFGPKGSDLSRWASVTHTPETFKERRDALNKADRAVNTVCLATGERSGIDVIDEDVFEGSKAQELLKKYAPELLELGPMVRTPSGGFHYWCKHSEWTRTMAKDGLDIRADGGLAIIPPSSNKKGSYTWLRPFTCVDDLPDFPLGLIGYLGGLKKGRRSTAPKTEHSRKTLDEINNDLCALSSVKWGYDEWLKIICALWTEYEYDETIDMLKKWLPEQEFGEYERKYNSRILEGITMGTWNYYVHKATGYSISGKMEEDYTPKTVKSVQEKVITEPKAVEEVQVVQEKAVELKQEVKLDNTKKEEETELTVPEFMWGLKCNHATVESRNALMSIIFGEGNFKPELKGELA